MSKECTLPTEVSSIALAAFLHDIGKILERAEKRDYEDSSFDYGYSHARYSGKLVDSHPDLFDSFDRAILRAGMFHHKPDQQSDPRLRGAARLIAEADRLSSGHDRGSTISYPPKANTVPLTTVFSLVTRPEEKAPPPSYWRLGKLTPKGLEPTPSYTPSAQEYAQLWKEFWRDLILLLTGSPSPCPQLSLARWDVLGRRWWWAVPSAANQDQPDISLYDHARTTAGITTALYLWHRARGRTLEDLAEDEVWLTSEDEKIFLFVTGDISGIQRYIFTLGEQVRGQARLIRARSFEILCAARLWARLILCRLGLPVWNILMEGGGRFLLLLPHTEHTRAILEDVRYEAEKWSLEHHGGHLALIISQGVEASPRDLRSGVDPQRFLSLWSRIHQDAASSKLRLYHTYLLRASQHASGQTSVPNTSSPSVLESLYAPLVGKDVCQACGIHPVSEEGEDSLCTSCEDKAKLGRILVKKEEIEESILTSNDFTQDEKDTIQKAIGDPIVSVHPLTDDSCLIDFVLEGLALPYYAPKDTEGNLLPFTELAQPPKEQACTLKEYAGTARKGLSIRPLLGTNGEVLGAPYLAMAKVDMDNLGDLFSGLPNASLTFTRHSLSIYASFSRMLDAIFTLCVRSWLRGSRLYLVFAGGDDLCLVGYWEEVFVWLADFYRKFSSYVCNPYLHFSGGITLGGATFPVRFLAQHAEEMLELAKQEGKAKVCVWEVALPWEEWENQLFYRDTLLSMWSDDESSGVGTRFLYQLLRLLTSWKEVQYGKVKALRRSPGRLFTPYLLYRIARLDDKLSNKVEEALTPLIAAPDKTPYIIAASAALYKLRTPRT